MLPLVLLVLFSISATFAFAQSPSLGIYMDFEAKPAAPAVEAMKKEVGKILKPTGLAIDWRELKTNKGHETFSNLIVLRFRGKCGPDYSITENEEAVPLASTLVAENRVLPFAEVACDEVRRTLTYAEPVGRQRALGLALGRVVAHELYHLLGQTTRHAGSGLAKATANWKELLSNQFTFTDIRALSVR